MTHQSEKELEKTLIEQLQRLGFELVQIKDLNELVLKIRVFMFFRSYIYN